MGIRVGTGYTFSFSQDTQRNHVMEYVRQASQYAILLKAMNSIIDVMHWSIPGLKDRLKVHWWQQWVPVSTIMSSLCGSALWTLWYQGTVNPMYMKGNTLKVMSSNTWVHNVLGKPEQWVIQVVAEKCPMAYGTCCKTSRPWPALVSRRMSTSRSLAVVQVMQALCQNVNPTGSNNTYLQTVHAQFWEHNMLYVQILSLGSDLIDLWVWQSESSTWNPSVDWKYVSLPTRTSP